MDAKSHSLHFLLFIAMCCKMHAQTICPSKCIVAWVAVVLFFSTVCSQMLLEMVCITWSIITNVALLHVETVSLRNVALWYSMCSRKTLSNIYHTKCALAKHCHIFTTPNTVKMCCGVVHFQMCPQTSDKMGNYENDGTPQDSRAV